jgi:hypothetical protein
MDVIANPAPLQLTALEVDSLWVLDDSNSMAEEQTERSERFGKFAQALAATGADFRIGVVSTSADEGGRFRTVPNGLLGECGRASAGLERCKDLAVDHPFLSSADYEDGRELDSSLLIQDFQCLPTAGT